MTIQSGDIRFVKSQVMTDADEGGGAPTANLIADGASNDIFPDVTEVDRAGGKLKVRKIFLGVRTLTTDVYMDANVIVEEPPNDDNVSVVLMTTGEVFDTRANIIDRVESYFATGTTYAGYLFGNHLAGQRTMAIAQKVGTDVPVLDQTLVLVKHEGLATQVSQFVRVRTVASEVRTFYDDAGNAYQLLIVTCGLDSALEVDYPGFDATKKDPTIAAMAARTTLRESVVADATQYYGVRPLAEAASLGDYSVMVDTPYTRLVPTAQTEIAIADARTNQVSAGYQAAGDAVTLSLTLAFSATQALYIGGSIVPGTLTIVRGGITLADAGGLLYNGSTEVGSVDYDNGIASLATSVWGTTGGTHQVTYTPAAVPDAVTQTIGVAVTAESRSLTQVLTLPSIPARGSLSVSYMSSGRWYKLAEDGTGRLAGSSASYGVGTLNYGTGTVAVTFGALPDLGHVIYQWVESEATSTYAAAALANGGKVFVPINSAGELSTAAGSAPFTPGTLSITWTDGADTRTVTDDGAGNLQGYGTGWVDYSHGRLRLSPTTLPAEDTVLTIQSQQAGGNGDAATVSWATSGGYHTGDLGVSIVPYTVRFQAYLDVGVAAALAWIGSTTFGSGGASVTVTVAVTVRDDGAGGLYVETAAGRLAVGGINYSTGVATLSATLTGYATAAISALVAATRTPFYILDSAGAYWYMAYIGEAHYGVRYTYASVGLSNPSPAVYFSGTAAAAAAPITVVLSALLVQAELGSSFELRGAQFTLGGQRYVQLTDGELVTDIDAATGVGTQVGNVTPTAGLIQINAWTAGASSTLTNWRGAQVPPTDGLSSPYAAAAVVFRTASVPLRASSLSVLGTLLDGTTFNVAVDANGKINGTRVKGRVNLVSGVVELWFVNPASTTAPSVDLSALEISGVTTLPQDMARTSTLRYNAVAYSYVPLSADVIGVDPVRLPSDGRVLVLRAGMFGVVGHTGTIGPATLSAGQTIDCGRVRLSRAHSGCGRHGDRHRLQRGPGGGHGDRDGRHRLVAAGDGGAPHRGHGDDQRRADFRLCAVRARPHARLSAGQLPEQRAVPGRPVCPGEPGVRPGDLQHGLGRCGDGRCGDGQL
ncbi:MAG: hypothetical protein QM569_14920 [Acidovorax sp.]|uniref:hypothetical protein n=1 Tax=Acidovorax sp. TaxID=1872122 RepID=UPI0039E38B14